MPVTRNYVACAWILSSPHQETNSNCANFSKVTTILVISIPTIAAEQWTPPEFVGFRLTGTEQKSNIFTPLVEVKQQQCNLFWLEAHAGLFFFFGNVIINASNKKTLLDLFGL